MLTLGGTLNLYLLSLHATDKVIQGGGAIKATTEGKSRRNIENRVTM